MKDPHTQRNAFMNFGKVGFFSMDANMAKCGIISYNYWLFTYGGYFTFEGVEYYASITKAHNRLYHVA